ncbi:MAG: flagellar basal body P-ring formation chaperone FlgA [Planctomycetota bacterium]|nr:flagellar basal body P-ring formation chaperone FlgA [Planctomycetota bacterium]
MRILTLSLLLGGLVQAVHADEPTSPQNNNVVQIVLRHAVRAPASAYVQVRDVAELSGGAAPLRERLGLYDLEASPLTSELVRISSAQVRYRLLLADIPDTAFQVHGKASMVVGMSPLPTNRVPTNHAPTPGLQQATPCCSGTSEASAAYQARLIGNPQRSGTPQPLFGTSRPVNPIPFQTNAQSNSLQQVSHTTSVRTGEPAAEQYTENKAERNPAVIAAKECVIKRLPWKSQDVQIRLASDIPDQLASSALERDVELDARLRTPWPPLGRVHVGVSVIRDGKRETELPVMLEVHQDRDVVTAKRKIIAGAKFGRDDLTLGRRRVTKLTGYPASVEALIGRVAARTIETGAVVRDQDIGTQPVKQNPVVIQREDRIRCYVKAGGIMTISVSGEALQDGRVGETIKVRNVDSKKIVQGRVISAHEVEISL